MAPASDLVAVPVGILVALETLQDVVGVGEARARSKTCACIGAGAAAAQEHHQCFRIDLTLELGQEMRIRFISGVQHPFDLDRVGDAADPVPFGTGAHIDQPGAGGELQYVPRFARCQGSGVGEIHAPGALLCEGEGFA